MFALTQKKAKPAVSYGGKYKIIDFPLSNCTNSGIDTVGVLTQYEPLELNAYIGTGGFWDLDSLNGGAYVLPPYMKGETGNWYRGTADAIYKNINFIDNFDPDHIIVLSGDQICTMDYDKMLQYHKEKGADCTISVLNVTYEEAKRFGIMNTDEDERIYEFEEKPAEPKSTKASMGIYIFKWKLIRQYLIDDGNDPESEHDFGKNIIPRMLEDGRKMYAYSFGYWRDVGTIDSLWEANMELLDENPQIDLNDDKMRIYTRNFSLPPHYIAPGASVKNSILADGCVIEGEVENCVIHSGVKIGKGSVVKNSVIMKDTVVRTDCQIDKALIDEEVVIEQGCKVGEGNNVTVIGYHCVALENATVEDGRYRTVDFMLSNMVNAGIKNVGLLTRRNYDSLLSHVNSGKDWGLNKKRGGLYIFPPYINDASPSGEYASVMDGLRGTLGFLKKAKEKYVLLGRSYVICNADFQDMLDKHIKSGADITLMYFDNSDDSTNCDYDGVYLKTDEDDKVLDMCYSEGKHRSNKKSMDAYIMKTTLLIDFIETAIAHNKKHFFFDVIVPNFDRLVIQGYEYKGYVGCITSLEAYYNVNMDMLKPDVYKELFLGNRRIYTKSADGAPAKYGPNAKVSNSLISSGCEIDGEVENSVIFRGSQIAEGAVIKNSVVMAEGFIAPQAEINHTILDRHVKVYSNAHLSGSSNHPVFIPKGASVNE